MVNSKVVKRFLQLVSQRLQLIRRVIRHAASGGARSNRPLANMNVVVDAYAIAPVNVGTSNEIKNQPRDLLCVSWCNPEQQNAGPGFVATTYGEFTKVSIKGHNEPVFAQHSFYMSKIWSGLFEACGIDLNARMMSVVC